MPDDQAPAAGGNVKDLIRLIAGVDKKLTQFENERDEINAKMDAERKKVKAAGVPLDVLRHARRIAQMEAPDRSEYDNMLGLCRDALKVPVQGDLPLDTEAVPTTH